MNRQDGNTARNALAEIRSRIVQGQITWTGPITILLARTALLLIAQAFVAMIFLLRGSAHAWLQAAPWWTVYGTLVDVGCLVLMGKFTRREGISLRQLISLGRLLTGRDLTIGMGTFFLVFPLFVGTGLLSGLWLYGTTHAQPYPGLLSARTLPGWAVIYSRSLWWMIWSPTEEMTYNGYCLARIQPLSGRTWVAVALVGFWWAIQHSFLPFIPDWRCFLWRFLAFVPGVVALTLIYLREQRLTPLILAHWPMDVVATFMTM